MIVQEIKCKSCLNRSKLTDYVINPYVGCQHACKYCYATFIKKWQNIQEEWGDFVYAKINCSELLEKELLKAKPGNIWLSSVTDPYLPLESKYKLTRKILEILVKYKKKFSVEILTKSALVKRDFPIIRQLNVELGLSINTLDEKTSRVLEPFASSPKLRIETLKEAKEQGIRVFGFISPVFPGITNLDELFKELQFCKYVWVELLNTKKYILDRLMPIIKKNFPNKVKDFELAINNSEEYFNKIKEEVYRLERKYNLKVKEIVVH